MKTIETAVYSFDELTDTSKQNAIEWYRTTSAGDRYFAETVFEDAVTIADIIGLDIRQTRKTLMDGSHSYGPTIYYSGFRSQGDGACFEGIYQYKKGAVRAIKEYAPLDKELHRIANVLQSAQKKHFYKLEASCKHRGYYYHSGYMQIDVLHVENQYRDIGDSEDEITQALRDFADWIYKQLETGYEYQNSDEQIIETIKCNEYQFTKDGSLF